MLERMSEIIEVLSGYMMELRREYGGKIPEVMVNHVLCARCWVGLNEDVEVHRYTARTWQSFAEPSVEYMGLRFHYKRLPRGVPPFCLMCVLVGDVNGLPQLCNG